MSFGKRPSTSAKMSSFRQAGLAHSRRAKYLGAAAGLTLIATGAYLARVPLIAHVHPAWLTKLTIPEGAAQLRKSWSLEGERAAEAGMTILWTAWQMAALCGDADTYEKTRELQKFGLSVFPVGANFKLEEAPNLYGPDASFSAKKMIDALSERRLEFCSKDYPFAIFDSRVAYPAYLEPIAEANKDKAQRLNDVRRATLTLQNKMKTAKGPLSPSELTGEEQAALSCIDKYVSDLRAQYVCYWNAMGRDGEALAATDLPPELIQTISRTEPTRHATTEEAYVSPDLDYRLHCREVHGKNYVIREVCEQEEEKARRAIRMMSVPDNIARYCDQIHDTYRIREVCYHSQLEAKSRLGE